MRTRLLALLVLAIALIAAYSPRPFTIPEGGTSASTAAGARDAIEHASAATIACSSPCTPGTGIKVVTVSGTTTINLPTLSTYANGQQLLAHCDSASSCTVTLDPSDSGTCDGGSAGAACSAITVTAHGVVGARRTSSSSWGSVQPGGLTASSAELRLASGAWCWAPQAWIAGSSTWVDVGACTALTVETTNASITYSGTTLTLASGLTDGGTQPHLAQSKAYVTLASLPIWSSTTGAIYRVEMSQTSMGSGSAYARWGWALATPTGNYDASSETHSAMRGGYDTTTWIWRVAAGTGTFGTGYNNATIPSIAQLWFTPGLATGTGFYYYSSATSTGGGLTVPTAAPTRLYVIAMAGGGTLTANVDVSDPRIHIIRMHGSP